MRIANPLYDSVVKFLLEDNQIAKKFLSILINEPIISLDIKPQEAIMKSFEGLSIMRIDFKAVIKTDNGKTKKVLIEIQKAKSGFSLSRFRKYLGLNYMEDDLISAREQNPLKSSLPILPIYILGFSIRDIHTPIVHIERVYKDISNDLLITTTHQYVEHLSHDCLIIQIPRLKMNAQTEIEKVLDVFNEKKYKTDDPHILDYTGDTDNPVVQQMLKRLKMAIADPDTLHALLVEQENERQLALYEKNKQKLAEATLLRKKVEEELKLIKKDKLRAEEDKLKAEQDKLKAEKEVEELKKQLADLIKKMG
jgi:hypothetical protein